MKLDKGRLGGSAAVPAADTAAHLAIGASTAVVPHCSSYQIEITLTVAQTILVHWCLSCCWVGVVAVRDLVTCTLTSPALRPSSVKYDGQRGARWRGEFQHMLAQSARHHECMV